MHSSTTGYGGSPGFNVIKLFLFVTEALAKQARVFQESFFMPFPMFVSKARNRKGLHSLLIGYSGCRSFPQCIIKKA
jgi:hypothetical protein